jgi:hypothetical protein
MMQTPQYVLQHQGNKDSRKKMHQQAEESEQINKRKERYSMYLQQQQTSYSAAQP